MPATEDRSQSLFAHEQYLHTLFSHAQNLFSLDDVVLALMKHVEIRGLLHDERFSRSLRHSRFSQGNSYRRLKLFLQRGPNHVQVDQRSC